tara:strand:- start:39 stop:725 length:687 start_codon:yes stop_codon:yes gene_type:complete
VPGPVTQIDQFMKKIGNKGGMALTTGFDVQFQFGDNSTFDREFYTDGDEDIVHMLCDEAQLPNVQSATGQMNRYLGEGQVYYPHTRIFTDISLGFLCDAQMTPFKFFQNWYNTIYGDQMTRLDGNGIEGARSSQPLQRNRVNRLKYMDEYVSTCRIMKTEPNDVSSSGRVPTTVMLENCYPYAIDAVPLSYGTSQVARVNVNFYYSRHTISHGNPGNDANFNIGSFFS